MEVINEFSQEVCNKIGYYVYRLIDPRNGQTFYVGKGKDNRVFAHVNDALKFEEVYEDENLQNIDTKENTKIQTIRDIKNAGLNVIHVIHRYGMTQNEAFEVESALIDAYPGLTNIQGGHNSDRGITNTFSLQQKYSLKVYDEIDGFKYMIIKVKWDRIQEIQNEQGLDREKGIYETVRSSWRISKNRAEQYPYVLGVVDGVVEGVYKVKEWKLAENNVRYEFIKDDNPDENIVKNFLKKRIPDTYVKKGMANPILYHD